MSKNAKLFKVGDSFTIDESGEAIPVENGGFRMLPGPKGTCEWCHVKHEPAQPHNQQSLSYQMKFHAINGRYPTWTDAMKHCDPDTQAQWRKGLIAIMKENNLEIPKDLL